MAFVPVPSVIQIRVQGVYLDEPVENVFHALAVEAPYTAGGATGLATAVRDAWITAALPHHSNLYNAQQVRAIGQASDTDFSVVVPFVGAPPGQDASPALPANNAFVVTHRTNKRGPWNRGRTYFTALVEANVTGNFVSQAYANACLATLNAVRTAIANAGYVMVVVSRRLNNAPRVNGLSEPITTFNVRNLRVDSQRGRNED